MVLDISNKEVLSGRSGPERQHRFWSTVRRGWAVVLAPILWVGFLQLWRAHSLTSSDASIYCLRLGAQSFPVSLHRTRTGKRSGGENPWCANVSLHYLQRWGGPFEPWFTAAQDTAPRILQRSAWPRRSFGLNLFTNRHDDNRTESLVSKPDSYGYDWQTDSEYVPYWFICNGNFLDGSKSQYGACDSTRSVVRPYPQGVESWKPGHKLVPRCHAMMYYEKSLGWFSNDNWRNERT